MAFKPQKSPRRGGKSPLTNLYWMYALIAISLLGLYYFQDSSMTKDVDWSDFEKAALEGDFSKMEILTESSSAIGILNSSLLKN